ncbi:MAG: 50S ribosomal protein L11 [Candidatus Cloacimonetes bacterium]|nr:50S ribosomal protein L11 [Candidatus Cloacimonadota bacterium]MCF7814952.1 50S ribosomal protein L11 [Candidatus Cloacimonadota bacterium]MCF7869236.1 50S ribosomal protein L11 [Candidatus Cloacimonadota bacterium]MCF7884653.1 50S ribosomal protein L11 [Candidatus Cloacimonadota bacterium]
MAKPKDTVQVVKLQLPAGKATPAPPVGPALGQAGINIGEFCKSFNDKTKDSPGMIFPVVIYVKKNKSYTYYIKTPPAAVLIKKEAGLAKGSGVPNIEKVGKITKAQVKKIAEMKMVDLNAYDLRGAMRMIEGTARNMGVEVVD